MNDIFDTTNLKSSDPYTWMTDEYYIKGKLPFERAFSNERMVITRFISDSFYEVAWRFCNEPLV